jgi:hypothetical protein
MSTTPNAPRTEVPVALPKEREVRVFSHSALFYWWPVWAVGFLMAIITGAEGHLLAVVPTGTVAERERTVQGHDKSVDVLVVPSGRHLPLTPEGEAVQPKVHVSSSKNLGVVFVVILLVIIVISNVPMHGLWSVLALLSIVLIAVLFALIHWEDRSLWDRIFEKLTYLDVRINAGGYILISLVLFIIWALTVFIFDHRKYVAVTPGQVRVCQAIGTGEDVYDTAGLTFAKRQDDLFRHWVVGLGSGDLVIHRPNTKDIEMPNVLFIGSKVKEMERLVREKQVV